MFAYRDGEGRECKSVRVKISIIPRHDKKKTIFIKIALTKEDKIP